MMPVRAGNGQMVLVAVVADARRVRVESRQCQLHASAAPRFSSEWYFRHALLRAATATRLAPPAQGKFRRAARTMRLAARRQQWRAPQVAARLRPAASAATSRRCFTG